MTSAASFIDALTQRRLLRAGGQLREPGEFPGGWAHWFAAMRPRRDAVTGDTAAHWVDLLAARAPARPPRASALLNRWQAFATLWRQDWDPPGREDRRARGFAAAVSAVVHVFLAIALVWLALVQWLPREAAPEGEDIIQVEYVGIAARPDVGGGEPQPAADAVAQAAPSPSSAATSVSETRVESRALPVVTAPQLETPVPDVAQREVPVPTTPAAQPLTVSAPAPDPAQAFVLPPTTSRLETRTATPQLDARVPELRVVDVPTPARMPQPRSVPAAVATPSLRVQEEQVTQRDIPTPVVAPTARTRPTIDVTPRALPREAPRVAARSIPMPEASSTPTAPAAAPAAAPVAASTSERSSPAVPAAERANATTPAPRPGASPGAGPRAAPTAGAWPSPDRGNDFDQATRNTPGGTRGAPGGLYNPDGSVRLAGRPGSASSGLPPGSLVQEIDDLDRAGTWLRRRPADYQGTRFDEAWRPNETLLAEWVRKSVSTVRIPIPGTKKTIVCKTVLLAMGGGCDVSDPDLNDQPARARPPPDIPFKPHLQEDNGAVKPAD